GRGPGNRAAVKIPLIGKLRYLTLRIMVRVGAILVAISAHRDSLRGEGGVGTRSNRLMGRLGPERRQQVRCILLVPGKDVVTGCAPKAINGDLVVGSLVYVEVCPAGIKAAVVLVAGDADQVGEGGTGVNGQQRIERAADGAESSHAGDRGLPGVPNRFATGLSGVKRFPKLESGLAVLPH